MIVSFEPQELRPLRNGAGHAQGCMIGFRSREAEPHQLGAGDPSLQELRKLQFPQVLASKELPRRARLCHGIQNFRMRVPEDQWTLAEREVQVVVAVDIDDVAPRAALVEQRTRLAEPAELAGDSTRQNA